MLFDVLLDWIPSDLEHLHVRIVVAGWLLASISIFFFANSFAFRDDASAIVSRMRSQLLSVRREESVFGLYFALKQMQGYDKAPQAYLFKKIVAFSSFGSIFFSQF